MAISVLRYEGNELLHCTVRSIQSARSYGITYMGQGVKFADRKAEIHVNSWSIEVCPEKVIITPSRLRIP